MKLKRWAWLKHYAVINNTREKPNCTKNMLIHLNTATIKTNHDTNSRLYRQELCTLPWCTHNIKGNYEISDILHQSASNCSQVASFSKVKHSYLLTFDDLLEFSFDTFGCYVCHLYYGQIFFLLTALFG